MSISSDKNTSTSTTDSSSVSPINLGNDVESPAFDFDSLRESRKQSRAFAQEKGEGTRKATTKKPRKQKVKKLSDEEKTLLFGPLFSFVSVIMQRAGTEPLSNEEVKTGIAAWEPLAERYLPTLDKYAIWVAPAMWTASVVMIRMDTLEKDFSASLDKTEEKKTEEKKNDSTRNT